MWIRSQDGRQLLKPDRIFCEGGHISCDTSQWQSNTIGEYSTEEKALKVLDMIQNEIEESNYTYYDNKNFVALPQTRVFEMPKDEEVE